MAKLLPKDKTFISWQNACFFLARPLPKGKTSFIPWQNAYFFLAKPLPLNKIVFSLG
jgi:hypothetical protein